MIRQSIPPVNQPANRTIGQEFAKRAAIEAAHQKLRRKIGFLRDAADLLGGFERKVHAVDPDSNPLEPQEFALVDVFDMLTEAESRVDVDFDGADDFVSQAHTLLEEVFSDMLSYAGDCIDADDTTSVDRMTI